MTTNNQPKLSVLICTYNRAELLKENLQSLVEQTQSVEDFEVIIIDNNSKDATNEVATEFAKKYPHFRVVVEKNQGLSYARNRGYREARADWVTYVDDDALAKNNYVERVLWVIENHPYLFFGGVYLPWYKYGRPKWFKDHYASNKKKYTQITPLTGDETVSGGVMVIQKKLLEKYDGFSTSLGMTGDKVAYGEETELQFRMRKDGVEIAYDPELIIYHLVAKYKMNVDWFLTAAFAGGRDKIEVKKIRTSRLNLLIITLTAIAMTIVHLLIYTPRLLGENYYTENWLIDVFRKVSKRMGVVYTALLQNSGGNKN